MNVFVSTFCEGQCSFLEENPRSSKQTSLLQSKRYVTSAIHRNSIPLKLLWNPPFIQALNSDAASVLPCACSRTCSGYVAQFHWFSLFTGPSRARGARPHITALAFITSGPVCSFSVPQQTCLSVLRFPLLILRLIHQLGDPDLVWDLIYTIHQGKLNLRLNMTCERFQFEWDLLYLRLHSVCLRRMRMIIEGAIPFRRR